MNKPNFSKGNKSFIEAANTLADYAQSVGVNPGGAPGWVHTPTGWQPPGSGPGTSFTGDFPWDLILEPRENDSDPITYSVYNPLVLQGTNAPSSFLTVTGDTGIELAADKYLVAKIDSLTTPEIEIGLVNVSGFNVYTFDGSAPFNLTLAQIPIWVFSSTETLGSLRFSGPSGGVLYGKKLVPSIVLRLFYVQAINTDEQVYRTAVEFL